MSVSKERKQRIGKLDLSNTKLNGQSGVDILGHLNTVWMRFGTNFFLFLGGTAGY